MTEDTNNVVDVDQYEARDEADPIHESAMAFFLAKVCEPAEVREPAGYKLRPTEMRKFAEELVSLSLAFAAAYDEDLFKRNLRLSLEYIDLRARYLRLKWLMKIRSEEGR